MLVDAVRAVPALLLAVPRAALEPLRGDLQEITRSMEGLEVLEQLAAELATIRGHVERLDDEVAAMHRDVQGIQADVVEMRSSLIAVGETIARVGGILPRARRRRRAEEALGPGEDADVA